MKYLSLGAAALALAACATIPAGAPSPRDTTGGIIPSGVLELGDWRRAAANAVAQQFQANVASRYAAGLALSAVSGDLRRNEFSCEGNTDNSQRGDPPAQICRKTTTIESCTHTWQVHLYSAADAAKLARARALYDRRCGNDGLLGGPN